MRCSRIRVPIPSKAMAPAREGPVGVERVRSATETQARVNRDPWVRLPVDELLDLAAATEAEAWTRETEASTARRRQRTWMDWAVRKTTALSEPGFPVATWTVESKAVISAI